MLRYLCIGAQRCGTTWLAWHLRRHPAVTTQYKKEIHFWNRHYDKGIEWYKDLFANPALIEGDYTPAYALLPDTQIAECRRHFPDVRLIFIVRKPLERAWSATLMFLRLLEMERGEASDQFLIDYLSARRTVMRSDYKRCIENWLRHYPREQLLVLHFDDIAHGPCRFLRKCSRHIGIDPKTFEDDEQLRMKINFSPDRFDMPARVRAQVAPLYASFWEETQPYIQRIGSMRTASPSS